MNTRTTSIEAIVAGWYGIRNKMKAAFEATPGRRQASLSHWFVLGIIEQEGSVTVKQLSAMLGISSPAVTQIVEALARSGYIVRKKSSRDRRAVDLRLSPAGRRHMANMKRAHLKAMATLFEHLTDTELRTYLRLHKKIATTPTYSSAQK